MKSSTLDDARYRNFISARARALMKFLYRASSSVLDFIHGAVRHHPRAEAGGPGGADEQSSRFVRIAAALESNSYRQEHAMLDEIVLGLGVVFFVATIAYAYACDRL